MPLRESYFEIERIVMETLQDMIRRTRGTCMTFTPKKIAKRAGLSTKPVTLSIVDHVLQTLSEKGLIQFYHKGWHGKKYIIHNTSPLWIKVKEGI